MFAVANNAINENIKSEFGITDDTTSVNGALLAANFSHPNIPTEDNATKQYNIVEPMIEITNALGTTFLAFFVSSATFTISSKPKYAKKITDVVTNIEWNNVVFGGNSNKSTWKPCFKKMYNPTPITTSNPTTSINVAITLKFDDSCIPM